MVRYVFMWEILDFVFSLEEAQKTQKEGVFFGHELHELSRIMTSAGIGFFVIRDNLCNLWLIGLVNCPGFDGFVLTTDYTDFTDSDSGI